MSVFAIRIAKKNTKELCVASRSQAIEEACQKEAIKYNGRPLTLPAVTKKISNRS